MGECLVDKLRGLFIEKYTDTLRFLYKACSLFGAVAKHISTNTLPTARYHDYKYLDQTSQHVNHDHAAADKKPGKYKYIRVTTCKLLYS